MERNWTLRGNKGFIDEAWLFVLLVACWFVACVFVLFVCLCLFILFVLFVYFLHCMCRNETRRRCTASFSRECSRGEVPRTTATTRAAERATDTRNCKNGSRCKLDLINLIAPTKSSFLGLVCCVLLRIVCIVLYCCVLNVLCVYCVLCIVCIVCALCVVLLCIVYY